MNDAGKPTGMKAFKIQDAVKKQVDRPKGPKHVEPAAPTVSAGFPRIEALVEAAVPDTDGLKARHAALLELAKAAKSPKERSNAARAAKAYERTMALLEGLFATKANMMAPKSS